MTSTDSTAPGNLPQVDPAQAAALAADGAMLVDVREPEEWTAGHIPDAVHVPLGSLQAGAVGDDRVVVAICRSGNRSGKAAVMLAATGVDVRNLAGGMKAWAEAGRAIARDDGTPGTVA